MKTYLPSKGNAPIADVNKNRNSQKSAVIPVPNEPEYVNRGKAKNDERRAWFIVLNNPRNYLRHWHQANRVRPETDIDRMPQADLAIAVCRSLCPDGSEDDIGVSVNVEEGNKTGTEHCHIVYFNPKKIRFKAVQNLFFKMAHIEPQQGTKGEADDYLNKKGKWENDPKGHTLRVPPFHLGLPLGDNRRAGSSEVVDRLNDLIDELVDKGMRPSEVSTRIAAMGIDEARYADRAERVAASKLMLRAEEEGRLGAEGEKMFVVWHIGKSGTGKTYSIRDFTRNRSTCYLIDPRIKDHPWDNYEYQPCVLWDEFRDTHMPYDAALAMLNREGKGSVLADARYFAREQAYCRIDLTSIVGPEKQWAKARAAREADGQDEPLFQLTRRINLIVYHFIDERYPEEDARHWCAVAMKGGKAYKHADQLIRRADEYLKNPYTGPQTEMAFSVDQAVGATVVEKDRPLLLGPADEVEHNIRLMMWKRFEGDPYREEKLAFLGLSEEERGLPPKKEKMAVADNSTVGVPRTEQIPQIASGAGRQFMPTPAFVAPTDRSAKPASLGSSLSAVVSKMMASQPTEPYNVSFGQQTEPEIRFTYDQEATPPPDVYEGFAPSVFDEQYAADRNDTG